APVAVLVERAAVAGALVARVADAVAVVVILVLIGHVGAGVAGVADAVAVTVGLIRVADERAVVAARRAGRGLAAPPLAVDGRARRVLGTGVTRVADAVGVAVRLAGVGSRWAVVADIAHTVSVAVRLIGIRPAGTVVAARRADRGIGAPAVEIEVDR